MRQEKKENEITRLQGDGGRKLQTLLLVNANTERNVKRHEKSNRN